MTELTGVLLTVQQLCDSLEARMAVLRLGTEAEPLIIPPVAAEGGEVHEALLDVRARLDLAEVLIREARRERRRFRIRAGQRKTEADERYDARLDALGDGAVRQEWQSGREREAKARVQTLDERRAAIRAGVARDMVDDCFEGLKDAFFGLLNVREELITRLRELQFESVLER